MEEMDPFKIIDFVEKSHMLQKLAGFVKQYRLNNDATSVKRVSGIEALLQREKSEDGARGSLSFIKDGLDGVEMSSREVRLSGSQLSFCSD